MAAESPIGTRIKRARERKRMSQAELADALGVSRSAVNAWENDRAFPQSSIGALEDILGISLDTPWAPRDSSDEKIAALGARIAGILQEAEPDGEEVLAIARRMRAEREEREREREAAAERSRREKHA